MQNNFEDQCELNSALCSHYFYTLTIFMFQPWVFETTNMQLLFMCLKTTDAMLPFNTTLLEQ